MVFGMERGGRGEREKRRRKFERVNERDDKKYLILNKWEKRCGRRIYF